MAARYTVPAIPGARWGMSMAVGNLARDRRLLTLVGGGVVAVLLVMVGPDLFYAIPWWFRKAAGLVGFTGLVALMAYRLLPFRPGDDLPPGDDRRPPPARWTALLGLAAVSALAVPLLGHPENHGFGDWEYILAKYEA